MLQYTDPLEMEGKPQLKEIERKLDIMKFLFGRGGSNKSKCMVDVQGISRY